MSTIGQYLKRKLDEKMAQDMGDVGYFIGTGPLDGHEANSSPALRGPDWNSPRRLIHNILGYVLHLAKELVTASIF